MQYPASLTSAAKTVALAVGVGVTQPDTSAACVSLEDPPLLKARAARARVQMVDAPRALPLTDQVKEHLAYLREVSAPGTDALISRGVAWAAARAWIHCWEATGYAMPVPVACTGPDGQMLYTWDLGEHHLELEITTDAPPSFFYRNRISGELWMEDFTPEDLPAGVVEKLMLFV